MTNKEEIIIDGVGVSGCEYVCTTAFCNIGCKLPFNEEIYCGNNPNCYYKQLQKEKFENLNNRQMVESAENLIYENSELYKNLKEKEQECEELKKRATIAEDNFACEVQARLYHQNEWLKFSKECEELKKQLETSEKWRIKAESLNEKLELNNGRYRKALEEIEKIVSGNYEILDPLAKQQISSIVNKAKEKEYANSGIITITCTVTCCSSRNATRVHKRTKSD